MVRQGIIRLVIVSSFYVNLISRISKGVSLWFNTYSTSRQLLIVCNGSSSF